MLPLTEAEKEAVARMKKHDETRRAHTQRGQRYYGDGPEVEAWRAERAVLDAEKESLEADPLLQVAALKEGLNEEIAKRVPAGTFPAFLTVAEQVLALLDTPEGQQTTGLVRQVLVRLANAAADKEWNDARARITFQRYESLRNAGLPDELVCQILVAEAGRPWPAFGASSSKK